MNILPKARTLVASGALTALVAGLTLAGPVQAAGGALSAHHSGTATPVGSCNTSSCTVDVSGTGTATFIGANKETGQLSATFNGGSCGSGSGTLTMTSSSNPANSVTAAVAGRVCLNFLTLSIRVTYTITGGTGTFAHAAGSGHIKATASLSGSYHDRWSGTLTY